MRSTLRTRLVSIGVSLGLAVGGLALAAPAQAAPTAYYICTIEAQAGALGGYAYGQTRMWCSSSGGTPSMTLTTRRQVDGRLLSIAKRIIPAKSQTYWSGTYSRAESPVTCGLYTVSSTLQVPTPTGGLKTYAWDGDSYRYC